MATSHGYVSGGFDVSQTDISRTAQHIHFTISNCRQNNSCACTILINSGPLCYNAEGISGISTAWATSRGGGGKQRQRTSIGLQQTGEEEHDKHHLKRNGDNNDEIRQEQLQIQLVEQLDNIHADARDNIFLRPPTTIHGLPAAVPALLHTTLPYDPDPNNQTSNCMPTIKDHKTLASACWRPGP